jgi:hypothetical protein
MGDCGLALLRFTGGLEDDRPDQVITLHGVVVCYRVAEFGERQFGVNGLYGRSDR